MCAQRRLRVFAVCMKKNLGFLATHWAHSEDSDQTGRMPRLIWVFAGRTVILLVLSWAHSQCVGFAGRTVILLVLSWAHSHCVGFAGRTVILLVLSWAHSHCVGFAGRTVILLVLSCRGSIIQLFRRKISSIMNFKYWLIRTTENNQCCCSQTNASKTQ